MLNCYNNRNTILQFDAKRKNYILGVPLNCEETKTCFSLDENSSAEELKSFFERVEKIAKEKQQKHLLFVMHAPCLFTLFESDFRNLWYVNVDSSKIVNGRRLTGAEWHYPNIPERQYPKLSSVLSEMLAGGPVRADFFLNGVVAFHQLCDFSAIKKIIKSWKRIFLEMAKITDLNDEADWMDILLHPQARSLDISECVWQCAGKCEPFTKQQIDQLEMFGKAYGQINLLLLSGINEFQTLFTASFREMAICGYVQNCQETEIYEANAIVCEHYAK